MNASANPVNATDPPPKTNHVPDWPRITFEVPCIACGHNLWGQATPECPNCGRRSTWESLLPLDQICCPKCRYQLLGLNEPRCPECGDSFDWASRLNNARRIRSRHFEFLWYDNPAPAFARSVRLAVFNPARLWREYADYPEVKIIPLLLLILTEYVIFAWGWQVTSYVVHPLINGVSHWTGSNLTFYYPDRLNDGDMFRALVWHIVAFMSLQLLFQTKRRLDLRWTHLLRIYAHASLFLAFCPALWCVLEALLDSTLFFTRLITTGRPNARAYYVLFQCVFGLGVFASWLYLAYGLKRSLKIPNAWAVSAVSILIGFLWSLRAVSTHFR